MPAYARRGILVILRRFPISCRKGPAAHGQDLPTPRHRIPLVRRVGGEELLRAARFRRVLHHRPAAAQRHRQPAHGPRLQQRDHGRADPLPSHAGPQHPVAAGYRPRRHRHPDGGGAPAGRAEPVAPRPRPREVPREGLGVEGRVRRHHHPPDPSPRLLGGLVARALHHGRGPLRGGQGSLRAPARGRPDLPRQAPGQLGHQAAHRDLRSGSGEPRREGLAVEPALPAGRRREDRRGPRLPDRRHHPSGNHARRLRRGGEPARSALPGADRQVRRAAAGRPAHPDHRRRLLRSRVRHRLREDHPGPRLQRLRSRQAPPPAADQHPRQGRGDPRQGPGVQPRRQRQ